MDWIGCGSEHGHKSWIGLDWVSELWIGWIGSSKMDPCPTLGSTNVSILIFRSQLTELSTYWYTVLTWTLYDKDSSRFLISGIFLIASTFDNHVIIDFYQRNVLL